MEMAGCLQESTIKQRREREGYRYNNKENKQRKSGEQTPESRRVARGESNHIKPAALRSFCNLSSSAQACASRSSVSEDGLPSSMLSPIWPILAAVSAEMPKLGVAGSSSRERENPCRNTTRPPNAARSLRDSGLSLGVDPLESEEVRIFRSHLLTLQ